MTGEPIVTIVGNLTGDPELRFTPSGAAVANFTVASTPRTKQGDEWVDGEPMFIGCSVWRQYAENVAESLQKGMRVMAHGRLKARSYEKDGQKCTVFELDVDEVGPCLRYATAKVAKTQRDQQPQQGAGWQKPQTNNDPWANQGPQWNGEAPF